MPLKFSSFSGGSGKRGHNAPPWLERTDGKERSGTPSILNIKEKIVKGKKSSRTGGEVFRKRGARGEEIRCIGFEPEQTARRKNWGLCRARGDQLPSRG